MREIFQPPKLIESRPTGQCDVLESFLTLLHLPTSCANHILALPGIVSAALGKKLSKSWFRPLLELTTSNRKSNAQHVCSKSRSLPTNRLSFPSASSTTIRATWPDATCSPLMRKRAHKPLMSRCSPKSRRKSRWPLREFAPCVYFFYKFYAVVTCRLWQNSSYWLKNEKSSHIRPICCLFTSNFCCRVSDLETRCSLL